MKRPLLTAVLAVALSVSMSPSASAILPYVPWLDPFAWMGFYGCGCGGYGYGAYGGGYGYGAYGGGYGCGTGCCGGYSAYQPVFPGYYGQSRVMSYPIAPAINSGGCNCGGSPSVQQYPTAPQPVSSYQPHMGYQPVHGYQPMAQYPPSVAHQQPQSPVTAYGAPEIPLGAPRTYSAPGAIAPTPGGTPMQPLGDVAGDHEFPAQSRLQAVPASPVRPQHFIQRVSAHNYGVMPRRARSYPLTVR